MSYILEALRRAERERAQGQIPGSDATGAAPTAPPNGFPLVKLLVALLAVAVLLIVVLLLRKPHAADTSAIAAPQPAMRAAGPKPAAIAPVTAPAPAPIDDADTSEHAVVQEGVSSMDDLGAQGETDEAAAPTPHVEHQLPQLSPRGSVTFAKKPLTAAKPPPPPDPDNDVVVEDATDSDAAAAEPAPDTDVASAQPITSAQPIAQTAPPSAALPAGTSAKPLSDMSAAYQAGFPHFTMEVHVYDPLPQRRFAMIDGKRYHEGDALTQGPRLVHIVPEGLVLDFKNERVLYPIGRH